MQILQGAKYLPLQSFVVFICSLRNIILKNNGTKKARQIFTSGLFFFKQQRCYFIISFLNRVSNFWLVSWLYCFELSIASGLAGAATTGSGPGA